MSPNEELAKRVVDRLVEAGVVAMAERDGFARRLAEGTVRQEEWEQVVSDAPGPASDA